MSLSSRSRRWEEGSRVIVVRAGAEARRIDGEMTSASHGAVRRIPSVAVLLDRPEVQQLTEVYGRSLVRTVLRELLEELRGDCLEGRTSEEGAIEAAEGLVADLAERLESYVGRPVRRVLNATGVFVHTNLGRSPLPRSVAAELPHLLDAYCDLEIGPDGGRGDRNQRCEDLLRSLTGAQRALVVNNNAAALVLVLATLARGREVVVSRGELVEIGGSFRVPAILEAAGATLAEVGSTNRTRLDDYAEAIGPETGLLLRVFPSNYRLSGFVSSVETPALVALSESSGVPLLVDEGSGLLQASPHPQLSEHPSLQELMEMGVPLACGSGDKVLGGPQAGLLVGRGDLIEACHRHPLYRALRPDRAALAALEGVLRLRLSAGRHRSRSPGSSRPRCCAPGTSVSPRRSVARSFPRRRS